jgi:GT2 family glycosyltransferase
LNWNNYPDTAECLRSLERLEYSGDFRVVVVDNGSTDGSADRLERGFPDVTLLRNAGNFGFAKGVNVGIKWALEEGAEAVWLLNNDTIAPPGALGRMLASMESDGKVGVVGSTLEYFDSSKIQSYGGGWVNTLKGFSSHCVSKESAEERPLDYITAASMLVRRKVFEEIGFFDERFFMYWEDVDFCFRARGAGWRLAVASGSTVKHKEGGSADAAPSGILRKTYARSMFRFFRKHCWFWPLPALYGIMYGVYLRPLFRGKGEGER